MKKRLFIVSLSVLFMGGASLSVADDPNDAPPPVAAEHAPSASEPAPSAPGSVPSDRGPAKYLADAKWEIAGYNNEEIIYSIIVTNQDSRIIHCNAELKGFYIENGERHSIADRQGSTIFPGKQVAVGHWMGMDQKSGATYELTCRAL